MRINTLIDKLCVKDELDKEDLVIINSLLFISSSNYYFNNESTLP